jgi:hypothetical protein
MKFNKEQREGLARFCDTLAASATVGSIVGATGHSALQNIEICGLIIVTPLLLAIGYKIRR